MDMEVLKMLAQYGLGGLMAYIGYLLLRPFVEGVVANLSQQTQTLISHNAQAENHHDLTAQLMKELVESVRKINGKV